MFGAIGAIWGVLGLVATGAVGVFGFLTARKWTRKARYVDQVQSPIAPVIAGVAAWVVAGILAAFLPLVGGFTALVFGLAVGGGVLAGRQDVERGRLNP